MSCPDELDLHDCLDLITGLAHEAGKIIKSRINEKKKIETKSSAIDFVTETDKEVEKLLIGGIKQKYPDHKIIGEESFADGIKEKLTCAPTWVIDPVDGTTNFVHSYPNVCISVGLVINCEAKLGIIFNPVLDMFFRAIKGEGAFLNDEPIKVSGVKKLSDALVALEYGKSRSKEFRSVSDHNINYLAINSHGIRATGSAAWNLAQVARGGVDLYVAMSVHAWDMAAGDIIVREAGGTVIDPDGKIFELMHRRILATSSSELANEVYSNFKQHYLEHD